MNKLFILIFSILSAGIQAQSVIQTINSGSVVAASSMISVGEIFIPASDQQSPSGLIAILAEINEQQLLVPHFELSEMITVYPNPTVSKIHFKSGTALADTAIAIYNAAGQQVFDGKLDQEQSVDLGSLAAGIYVVQLNGTKNKSFKIIKY